MTRESKSGNSYPEDFPVALFASSVPQLDNGLHMALESVCGAILVSREAQKAPLLFAELSFALRIYTYPNLIETFPSLRSNRWKHLRAVARSNHFEIRLTSVVQDVASLPVDLTMIPHHMRSRKQLAYPVVHLRPLLMLL